MKTILFLCVHNAGRSQMAAAWARSLGGSSVVVLSGGSDPKPALNPSVVEAMAEVGIDLSAMVPRRWADEDFEMADVVVTMGCGDECPYVPSKRYVDWKLSDPSGMTVEQVRPIRDEIKRRVLELLSELQSD